jgi:hypothetical protein
LPRSKMLKKIGWAVILIGLIYLLYACGDVENSVNGKVLSSLAISPTSAALVVGGSATFTVTATYTDGTAGSLMPAWSVTNSLGSITTAAYTGIFTATMEGTGGVIATSGGLSVEAAITVTAGPTPEPGGLTTIEVLPTSLNMPVGETQTFTATATNASGEAIELAPSWNMRGSAIGTFTSSGTTATLEAKATGHAVISCSSGEVTATVPVTIEGHIVNITVEADTYVDEANPTVTEEGQTTLQAGFVSATAKRFEAYLRFSLASLPAGVSIESATLKLYVNSTDSLSFQFYNLSSAFNATTTWNTKPTDGSAAQATTFTDGQYNNISSDTLLTTVRAWYANPSANFGLALRQDSATNGLATLLSKENGANPPILNILYK